MSYLDENEQERYIELLKSVPIDPLQTDTQLIALDRVRKQRTRRHRLLKSTVVAAIIMITLLGSIRVSPAFAAAIAQIPGLKPLIEMIAFDKGMEDIITNEYYEPINASQTINGKKLTITGVVADESGMIISYKLDSDEDLAHITGVKTEIKHGTELLEEASIGSSWVGLAEETYQVENTIDVVSSQGMDYSTKDFKLIFSLRELPETVFEIPFTLKKEIKASKHYKVNKDIIVDGQRFTIHELIISPIRSELKMSIDPSNTKKILKFEDIRIYDEYQEEWGKIKNGFVGFGDYEDEQFSIMLESNYFRIPENITIELREIEAIDKADEYIVIDFEKKTVISQPENISIELEIKDNFEVQYKVPPYKKNEFKGVLGKLIDADDKTYYSYSTWISKYEDYMLIRELYDITNAEELPANPVKLEVTRYEQYLTGIGRMQVELK